MSDSVVFTWSPSQDTASLFCCICGKMYKKLAWYNKHVQKHLPYKVEGGELLAYHAFGKSQVLKNGDVLNITCRVGFKPEGQQEVE